MLKFAVVLAATFVRSPGRLSSPRLRTNGPASGIRLTGTTRPVAVLMTLQLTVKSVGGRNVISVLSLVTVALKVTGICPSTRVTVCVPAVVCGLLWQTSTWFAFGSSGQLSTASGTPSPSRSAMVSLTLMLTVFVSESWPSLTVNCTR